MFLYDFHKHFDHCAEAWLLVTWAKTLTSASNDVCHWFGYIQSDVVKATLAADSIIGSMVRLLCLMHCVDI